MSQSDVTSFLLTVRGKDASALGPAILTINGLSMPDMLMSFQQMSAEERTRFNQAAFDGIPAKGCGFTSALPEARRVGIDRIKFAFRVVMDRRVPMQIPGDLYETGQMKDAYDFLRMMPPSTTVWATCIGSVCDDALLRKQGDNDVVMGGDQTYGQAGWEVGIRYGTSQFNDLPRLITSRCSGRMIKKLSINAHGDAGEFAVNGVDEQMHIVEPGMKASELEKLRPNFGKVLDFLNNVMTQDGMVLLQGCLAGKSLGGTSLLNRLSTELRPRKIVAFSTVGYQSTEKQKRDGEQCREPGARDTPYFSNSNDEYNRYFKDGQWNDLNQLPWQSETSTHAKVSQNGTVIRGAEL
jgi:hypothetical protein